MRNIEELKQAFTHITTTSVDAKTQFSAIAKALLQDCVIVKGMGTDRKEYRIREIEFYLMRKDYQDYVTYPRSCNACDWFFHQSGVDIAFKSDYTSKDNKVFTGNCCGGVLLRTIERLPDGKIFDGPLKLVNELFDRFSALQPQTDVAHLEVREGLFNDEVHKWYERHNTKGIVSTCQKRYGFDGSNTEPDEMHITTAFTKCPDSSKTSSSSSYRKLLGELK